MQSCVKCKGNEREMNLLPGPVLYTILEREGKLRKKKKRRQYGQAKRPIHSSVRVFVLFFMTAGVLIVAAGSLLQHYLLLRHPVFIPMHIELEMYGMAVWMRIRWGVRMGMRM